MLERSAELSNIVKTSEKKKKKTRAVSQSPPARTKKTHHAASLAVDNTDGLRDRTRLNTCC